MGFLQPDMHVRDIHAIDLDTLWGRGFRGILLDLDNTLLPYGVYDPVPEEANEWLQRVLDRGFKVALYSNATKWKVDTVCRQTKLFGVHKAIKPLPLKLASCIKKLGLPKKELITIGDQMFTDILGGNLAGIYTILVEPIHNRDFWGTRVLRWMERVAGRKPLR